MVRFWLEAGYATDVGRLRQRNEDSFAVYAPSAESGDASPVGGMLLVADGMGGERAGDRASQMAAEGFHQCFASGVYRTWPESQGEAWLEAVTARAIRDISREILRIGELDPERRGLGSTVVLTVMSGERMIVANVGDSRCYRLRDREIEQLTVDHTWVERQVRAGLLSPEEARRHPHRNILTRSLGDEEPPTGDLRTKHLDDGDLYLLCSDGLTESVTEAEILTQAASHDRPQPLAEALVRLANEKDGSDNITAVVGRCHRQA